MAKQDGYPFMIELLNITLELFQNVIQELELNDFLNIWIWV